MKFTTIKDVVDRKSATPLKSLRSIKSFYTNKNTFIKTLFMDNEFEVLRDNLREELLTLNTTATNQHVPQIEIQVKVVKERVQSTWNSLPYKNFPNRMISCMVENEVFCLNALQIYSGMYSTISLRTLLTGITINFSKHRKIQFGAYAEPHQKPSH